MKTQIDSSNAVGSVPFDISAWLSVHVHYHEDLDRVVLRLVKPLVSVLAGDGLIDAFHFLRYGLGGPHVRFRCRLRGEHLRGECIRCVEQYIERFLDVFPSTESIPLKSIEQSTKTILAGDPNESDHVAYPDNHRRFAPFHPEVGRYGGPSLYAASLEVFTLSSVAGLAFLTRHGERSRSSQLAFAFQLLVRQALGFARSRTELADLLRYGVDYWGARMPTIVEKGERLAASKAEFFSKLLTESFQVTRALRAAEGGPLDALGYLAAGAEELSRAAISENPQLRVQIAASHLHMTASRVGLSNTEEVYLSAMMTSALATCSFEVSSPLGAAPKSLLGLTEPALRLLD